MAQRQHCPPAIVSTSTVGTGRIRTDDTSRVQSSIRSCDQTRCGGATLWQVTRLLARKLRLSQAPRISDPYQSAAEPSGDGGVAEAELAKVFHVIETYYVSIDAMVAR